VPQTRKSVLLGLAPQARGTGDEPHRRRREPPRKGRLALGVGDERPGAGHGRRRAGGQPPGIERPQRRLDDGGRECEERRLELDEGVLEAEGVPLELANRRLELERKEVDSARRPRRVGGGALDQGDGAGLGQDSGLGHAGRRAKARWVMAH